MSAHPELTAGYFDMPITLSLLFPLAPLAAICQPAFQLPSEAIKVTGFEKDYINWGSGLPFLLWFTPLRGVAPILDFAITGAAAYYLYDAAGDFANIFTSYKWDAILMFASL